MHPTERSTQMKYTGITPIHSFNNIYVKREDLAYWSTPDYPSGSKVRQYLNMAGFTEWINGFYEPGTEPPCIVGCSANSCMQIYVAAAAKQLNTKSIIYVPKRKTRSDATKYAERLGAEINEIKPGYLSVIRKAARQRAIDLKHYVEWNRTNAIQDTIDQCINIPENIKRIIIPTGSGLTAAGVVVGVHRWAITKERQANKPKVIAIGTSPMTDGPTIMKLAGKFEPLSLLEPLQFIPPDTPYDIPVTVSLPDNTPLDPFYAAKAWKYIGQGDLLWPPGLRPVISMPEICREALKAWDGPNE